LRKSSKLARGLAGLNQHRVRRWISWQRWTLLAMFAHALLAVIAARSDADVDTRNTDNRNSDSLIALTCNEIRRLFSTLIADLHTPAPVHWPGSAWRRRHQPRPDQPLLPPGPPNAIAIYGWSIRVRVAARREMAQAAY
jgi:hypothetical protein